MEYFTDNVDLKALLKESQDRQAALYSLEATVQFQSRQFKAALNKIAKLKKEITLANKKLAKRRSEVKEYHQIIDQYKAQCPLPLTKEQADSLCFAHGFYNDQDEKMYGHMTIFLDTREDQEDPKIHIEIEDGFGVAFGRAEAYEFQRALEEASRRLEDIEKVKNQTLTVRVNKADLALHMRSAGADNFQVNKTLDFLESRRV